MTHTETLCALSRAISLLLKIPKDVRIEKISITHDGVSVALQTEVDPT